MNPETPKGIKRKLVSDGPIVKRNRSTDVPLYSESGITLLHLSDYTLNHILKYLDATSLFFLSQTCERFNSLVQDDLLWIDVDARHLPNSWEKNRFLWKNVHKNTKSILLAGNRKIDMLMPIEKLVITKMFTSLTVLALEHQCIKYCKLNDFPNTLHELSLRWSFIPRHQEFFRFALHAMARLKTLILDHCKWLEASSFMSFCRFPSLEILSVYMCKKLGDDDISSVSVAGRLGFRQLKVVDLRFTGLGDLFVRTFYANTSLQIIYLQNFPATYYLERWQRKIDILDGAKMIQPTYISDDEDNNNISKNVLRSRFNITDFDKNNTQTINNSTITVFKRLHPSPVVKERPKSVLYRYPYKECTCGFVARNNQLLQEPETFINDSIPRGAPEDSDEDPSDTECTNPPNCWVKSCLQAKLHKEKRKQFGNRISCSGSRNWYFLLPPAEITCGMVVNDSCASPEWCHEEATPNHIVHNWMFKREPRNEFEIELLTYGEKNFRAVNHLRCYNCGCDDDIVIIGTNSEGNLEQINRPINPDPVVIPTVRESEVGIVINRIVDFTRWLRRYNYDVDPERVLRGFNKCLDISDLLAPAEGRTAFVAELASLIIQFAKNKQNIYYVLCYHAYCLKDAMTQLLMYKTNEEKKTFLLYFFKNLVYAERIGNDNLLLDSKSPKKTTKKVKDFIRTPDKRFKTCRYVANTPVQPFRRRIPVPDEDDGTNIRELSFRGFYHITDTALEALSDLDLKLLDVTGTNVTVKGLEEFLKKNPKCRIIHEAACVCTPTLHF